MPNPVINRRLGGTAPPGFLLLEDGTYFVLEGSTDRLAVTPKGAVQPGNLPANAGLALADESLITNDPGGTPASQASTIQRLLDSINLLSASAALTLSDVIAVFTAAGVRKATLQKVFDATETLADAATPLTGDEIIVISDGTALGISLHDWVTTSNNVEGFTTDRQIVKGAVAGTDSSALTPRGDPVAASTNGVGASTGQATSDADTPPSFTLISGTTADTGRSGLNGVLQFTLVEGLRFSCICKLSSISEVRMWCGLFTAAHSDISGTDTVGGAFDWLGFRFSTDAGDTDFMRTHGAAGSGSFVSTGVAADTDLHCFEWRLLSTGNVSFYIDRVLVGSNVTVTTPTSSVMRFVLGITPLDGNSKNLSYCKHSLMQRWIG